MNPTRQAFQCSLEHKRMRVVGPHGFGDEDELDGQGEVPSDEVFVIGIGNNGGARGGDPVAARARKSGIIAPD